jgi:hypothetical protein
MRVNSTRWQKLSVQIQMQATVQSQNPDAGKIAESYSTPKWQLRVKLHMKATVSCKMHMQRRAERPTPFAYNSIEKLHMQAILKSQTLHEGNSANSNSTCRWEFRVKLGMQLTVESLITYANASSKSNFICSGHSSGPNSVSGKQFKIKLYLWVTA